jgi:hypothetical protein
VAAPKKSDQSLPLGVFVSFRRPEIPAMGDPLQRISPQAQETPLALEADPVVFRIEIATMGSSPRKFQGPHGSLHRQRRRFVFGAAIGALQALVQKSVV